jgi:hypothetical protein
MTALYDAIEERLEYLHRATTDKKVLVVISAGGGNASPAFNRVLRQPDGHGHHLSALAVEQSLASQQHFTAAQIIAGHFRLCALHATPGIFGRL